LDKITENENNTHEDEFGAKLNFRIPLSIIEDQKGRIRFGGRVRLKTKERDNNFFEYSPTSGFETLTSGMPLVAWDAKGWDQGEKYAPGTFVDKNYLG